MSKMKRPDDTISIIFSCCQQNQMDRQRNIYPLTRCELSIVPWNEAPRLLSKLPNEALVVKEVPTFMASSFILR